MYKCNIHQLSVLPQLTHAEVARLPTFIPTYHFGGETCGCVVFWLSAVGDRIPVSVVVTWFLVVVGGKISLCVAVLLWFGCVFIVGGEYSSSVIVL